MATVAEIQRAITSLPKTEYEQLRSWFDEYDWDEWIVSSKRTRKQGSWTSWPNVWQRPSGRAL